MTADDEARVREIVREEIEAHARAEVERLRERMAGWLDEVAAAADEPIVADAAPTPRARALAERFEVVFHAPEPG